MTSSVNGFCETAGTDPRDVNGFCETAGTDPRELTPENVKTNPTSERIAQLAAITRMERGHLSVIRTGPDGQPYHNLQHRENGRNVSEYIPRDQVAIVQENITAYSLVIVPQSHDMTDVQTEDHR